MPQPDRKKAYHWGLNLTLLEKRRYRSVPMSMGRNEPLFSPFEFLPRITICPCGLLVRSIH